MLLSASHASGRRRPSSPTTPARNMQKSGSTEGPLGCGLGSRLGRRAESLSKCRKEGKASLLFLLLQGWVIPSQTWHSQPLDASLQNHLLWVHHSENRDKLFVSQTWAPP